MSSFQDKHDTALLDAPWLTKDIDGDTWLFKYAPDPDRAGYIFLATDLKMIYFESLHAPSIPSRLNEIASHKSKDRKQESLDAGNVVAQSEGVLRDLGEWCWEKWDEVEMTVRPDHFYDKIFGLSAEDFEWKFNVAELDLRRCVSLLSVHLMLPIAKSIASTQNIKVPAKATPATAIAKILANELVAATINLAGPSRAASTKKEKALPKKETKKSEEVETESPLEEEEETQDYVSGSEDEVAVEETQPPPSAQKSPTTRRNKRRITSGSAESPEKPSQVQLDPDTEMAPADSPTQQADEPAEDTDKAEEENSQAEVKVTETLPSQLKPSQKSKKEREKEEEEEVERRREEMKRKMEHGAGGRLGKRKLRR